MKKVLFSFLSVCLLASCGNQKLVLDGNYSGAFFAFSHPANWKVIPSDVQVVIENENNSASFKFLLLESAKKNDINSITEMIDGYQAKINSSEMSVEKSEVTISSNKTIWFDSSDKNLRSIAFFMPVDGGVFSGQMENVSNNQFSDTVIDIFKSFYPKSIPQVAKPDETAEFITHNGVIYSIAFPKTWKVSGDNPMLIKSDIRMLEISVETSDKVTPDKLALVATENSSESFLGDCKAMVAWSDDKTSATFRVPLHGKIMSIKATGYKNGMDSVLEKCLKSFRYFPDKDMITAGKKPDDKRPDVVVDSKPIKPAEDISVKPVQNTLEGDVFEGDLFRIMLPKGWTSSSPTNMVTEFYPPDKESKTSITIFVQTLVTKQPMEIAKDIVDSMSPGTQINEINVGKLKGAQFTYDLGAGPTVTTILTTSKAQFMLNYSQGSVDYTKIYAQILGTFEAK
jgi:hypothetical protein